MMLRPWPKCCFCYFEGFGPGRNTVFAVFCSSAMAETLFLSFFARRPWPKRSSYHFGGFGCGRRINHGIIGRSIAGSRRSARCNSRTHCYWRKSDSSRRFDSLGQVYSTSSCPKGQHRRKDHGRTCHARGSRSNYLSCWAYPW